MQPNAKPKPKPARSAGREGAAAQKWVPILHIEDDPNDRELLLAAVGQANVPFQIYSASDANQAFSFLNHARFASSPEPFPLPALILLDLKMPGTNGTEVLKWIRAQPRLSSIPVVVLSGSGLEEDMREAYACGANAFLIKPVSFNALVDMVKCLNLGWFVAPQNGSLDVRHQQL
jgi:CheY-like chemotaxis protein